MRNEFVRHLKTKVEQDANNRVVVVTGDLGFSVLEPLAALLGDRFVNAGVAEASMTTMAAAWAKDGFKVFTYSIMPFATLRCLEQIRNDICYHNLDVTVVGIGAGYGYGGLGPTHHCTEDLAAMWSLPNMQVFNPADVPQTWACSEVAWSLAGPKYLRLGKGGEGELKTHGGQSAELLTAGRAGLHAVEYRAGKDLSIVTTGNILAEVLAATQTLPDKSLQILSCPVLKPFPAKNIVDKLTSSKVLLVDEMNPYGGFASQCAAHLGLHGVRLEKMKALTAPDAFADTVGTWAFQRQRAGLGSNQIRETILSML